MFMKKILILLALPLLFNSCLKDDEDKFSKSATERIEEAVKEAITVLQGAENGWRMELYPEGERIYGGYTLFLKFNTDNTVVASSENFAAGKTESSYYSVVAESGPVLAFDTNNDIIHFYSSPTTGAELGIGTSNGGLEGDSDFIVMEAQGPQNQQLRLPLSDRGGCELEDRIAELSGCGCQDGPDLYPLRG